MQKLFTEVKDRKFQLNEKGELKQNERNGFRAEFLANLSDFLTENGVPNLATKDGLAVEVENTEIGAVTVVVGVTVKTLEFDALTESEEFAKAVAEKARIAKEKAEAKAKKIAQKNAK